MRRLFILLIAILATSNVYANDRRYHYCIAWFVSSNVDGVVKRVYTDLISTNESISILEDSFAWHIENEYSDYIANDAITGFHRCYQLKTRIFEKAKRDLKNIIEKEDPKFYIIANDSELIIKVMAPLNLRECSSRDSEAVPVRYPSLADDSPRNSELEVV